MAGSDGLPADGSDDQPKESVSEPPPEPKLHDEFIFPDGSTYVGQYEKQGKAIFLHGDGLLQTGSESFKGVFDRGFYKVGRFTSSNGAVYTGCFRNNVFHGYGEYAWSDGRVFRGMWNNGQMHGRGQYLNFYFGAEKAFTGFSFHGSYASSPREQQEAKDAFMKEYGDECIQSASLTLRAIASQASAEGPPAEYAVPVPKPPPEPVEGEEEPAEVEEEPPESIAERTRIEEFVAGPFPDPGVMSQAAVQAFVKFLDDGDFRPAVITVSEKSQADFGDSAADVVADSFSLDRLKKRQLEGTGQCVVFVAEDAEPGGIKIVVLVNCSTEFDLSCAAWKLVHCDVAA